MEYMMAELLELSGNHAKQAKKKDRARITPQFLTKAIKTDKEFDELLSRAMLSGGGVIPKSDKDLKDIYGGKKGAAGAKSGMKMPASEENSKAMGGTFLPGAPAELPGGAVAGVDMLGSVTTIGGVASVGQMGPVS
ncbi:unnamed protein product [Amoebophrya sp. A120]|nr:unnamed protein product [Amoebophrya sp. A120]|eukprot:GSA120T00021570001.1